jgi:hypothetical protein
MGEAEDEDADAEIQRAIAMSMNPDEVCEIFKGINPSKEYA